MIDYFIGIVITFLSAFLFQIFGICLTKNKKSYAYSFVIGYIIYSFLVAIVGIPIQIFNLPWVVFFVYMIILLLGVLLYIGITIRKKELIFSKDLLFDYIKHNWFLYVGAVIIICFSLTHLSTIWANNLTDDAYYLNRMATLPYTENPFQTDPGTGLYGMVGFSSYSLNVFELEASFYIFITGIDPALYARLFLALLNYFIMLNSIQAFMQEVLVNGNSNSKMQFITVPVFLVFVMNSRLFIDTDTYWTIVTAAYFGSSLVKTACTFIALLPLLKFEKLTFKKVVLTICTCVVMISKSSTALPVLFLLAISYLVVLFCVRLKKEKENKYLLTCIVLLITIFGLLVPNQLDSNELMLNYILNSTKNILVLIPLSIIGLYAFKNIKFLYLLLTMVLCIFLIACPEINDIFENLSQYSFVAERTRYTIWLFIIIVGTISLIWFVFNHIGVAKLGILSFVITLGSFCAFCYTNYNKADFLNSVKVIYRNKYLMPNSTIELGKTLEEYYTETGNKLNVMMHAGVVVDNYAHFPAGILRTYSPHTNSIIAGIRISETLENAYSDFNGFSIEEYHNYENFVQTPNQETLDDLNEILNKYPFNCIVGTNFSDEQTRLLSTIGYEKYQDVVDTNLVYNIYIKS